MARKKEEITYTCIRPCWHNMKLWELGEVATKEQIVMIMVDEEGKEYEYIPRHFELD